MKDKDKTIGQFQSLVSNIPGIVYRAACDSDWTTEYISDYVEEITGYPASDFTDNTGRSFASIIHSDDRAMVKKAVMEAIDQRKPYVIDYRIIDSQGRLQWVNEKGQAVFGKNDEVLYLDGVIFDISERNQMEEELCRYEHIVSSSTDMLALLDNQYIYRAVNKSYSKAFGLTNDKFIDNSVIDMFGLEFFNAVIKPHADQCLTGENVNYQDWFDFPDTGKMYMDINYYPYTDSNNKVQGFVVSGRNITERKQAMEDREKVIHSLDERVKELKCMHGVAASIQTRSTLAEIFQDVVDLIPPGWHYPEITRGRVIVDGKEYVSESFEETEFKQSSDIIVNGQKRGAVEVYYLQKCPNLDEGTFMNEERHLIDGIARIISEAIDRKQAEENLQVSALRLNMVSKASGVVVWDWDIIANKLDWSDAYYQTFGYTKEDTLPTLESWSNFIHPDEMEDTLAGFQKVIDSGETMWTSEYRFKKKDSSYAFTLDWGTVIHDEKGKPVRMIGAMLDITDRKQAEKDIKNSEERYRSLAESTTSIIWTADAEGGFAVPQDSWEKFTGQPWTEHKGFGWAKKIHPDDIEHVLGVWNKACQEKILYETSGRIWNDQKQQWRDFEVTAVPITNPDGSLREWVGIIDDITDRKQAEESLKKAQGYISNIVDSMPSVLIGVDPAGKVTQWNSEAQRTTGVLPNDAVGHSLVDVFPRLANEMEWVREAMQARQVRSDLKRECNLDGKRCYEDVTIYPLMANGIEGAVIRVDDVTERVQIEEMMVQSEKMLSIGGLAAGMAHEINNPIAGMIQTASVMGDRLTNLDMSANIQAAKNAGTSMETISSYMKSRGIIKMLNGIHDSGSRAANVIDNMLSFSRKSDSSFSLNDPIDLLDRALDLAGSDYDLKKKYDFRQIEIVREYQDNLPKVLCESTEIQQVLLNVLRNGAESMQDARETDQELNPRLILRLMQDKQADMLTIEIENNGPGMNEETRKRVFEPFFTTKPTDQGTGLGLSVSCFIITENHNGQMSVESTPGEGTTFIIKLPLKRICHNQREKKYLDV